ncbi:protein-glutamate methylesterase/protein-glutamine glutaminase [Lapillicoccus jejuensis]|uniref:Protein-glutamate methylesterase/protein-glutamine glutaminase n=1 Tax=Lapillicoccus jejuensis TaxID=402171 RepID=A0A542E4P8_9MICO|nr:chemotaxis response regulator protein-glutamate methylesterase [Lapillicoccus jejuensis]TQJ10246.1 two-component system chemotaxis response regulator CheB [Lapillicoccus jejuensis]
MSAIGSTPATTRGRTAGTTRTRVLIVDDSAVVRQVLTAVLSADPGIEVVGSVADPIFAMARMNRDWPDVVVLDLEMPRMDGLTFLRRLMAVRPTPVVICSTLTEENATTSMRAMAAGAMAVVAKPREGLKHFLQEESADLVATIKSAAAGDMRRVKAASVALASHASRPAPRSTAAPGARTGDRVGAPALEVTTERVVAIGCSTGGTQALEVVLTALPRIGAGIVIAQHMPEKFTAAFAARLDSVCSTEVVEAADGDRVLPGRALVAPGGRHLRIERDGAQYRARIDDGPRVNRHRPSVDVLFGSVAHHAGPNALGIILTGMGDDGARGLLQMRQAGARTLGQDEASCVVYGMPLAARGMGAVEQEVALGDVGRVMQQFASAS